MIDPNLTRAAVHKILSDRDRVALERVIVRQKLLELQRQDEQLKRELIDLVAAGRVFGAVVAMPARDTDYDNLVSLVGNLSKLIKENAWKPRVPFPDELRPTEENSKGKAKDILDLEQRIIEEFWPAPKSRWPMPMRSTQVASIAPENLPSTIVVEEEEDEGEAETSARVPVKDIVLSYLTAKGAAGATSAEMRKHLQDAYGADVNEKSLGMTLYRLSQQSPRPVTREGHTWFIDQTQLDLSKG